MEPHSIEAEKRALKEQIERDFTYHAPKGDQVQRYADTGERISHAFRAIVTLDVNEINQVELFYYKADEQGRITVDKDMEPVICSVVVKNPEIDVMALEARKEQPRDTSTKESKASGRSCGMD